MEFLGSFVLNSLYVCGCLSLIVMLFIAFHLVRSQRYASSDLTRVDKISLLIEILLYEDFFEPLIVLLKKTDIDTVKLSASVRDKKTGRYRKSPGPVASDQSIEK